MMDEKNKLGLLKTDTEDESWGLWSKYVLISLEKLADEIKFLSEELHHFKEETLKDLLKVKEEIRAEMSKCREGRYHAMDKVKEEYEKWVGSVTKRIEVLEGSSLKEKLEKKIDDLKKDHIDPMSKDLTSIKTKLAIYAVIAGMIGSSLIFALFSLARHYIIGG